MKSLKLLTTMFFVLASTVAIASDQEVGYCAAFHAAMGSNSIAMKTLRKAKTWKTPRHTLGSGKIELTGILKVH